MVGYPSPCVLGNFFPCCPFPRQGSRHVPMAYYNALSQTQMKPLGSPSIFFLEESKSKPGMAVQVVLLHTDPFSSSKSQEEALKADVALVTLLQLGMWGGLDSTSHSAFGLLGGGRTWQGCLAWCRLYLSLQTWELKCLSVYGGRWLLWLVTVSLLMLICFFFF